MNKNHQIAFAVAILAASSGAAWAQSTPDSVKPQYQIGGPPPKDDAPKGISLADGVTFFPSAKLGLGRDDNMFLTGSNKTSSDLILLEAGGLFEARQKNRVFALGLMSKSANYRDSSADNYRDYTVRGSADLTFTSRAGLQLGATYDRGHDPRGSTDRGVSTSPDVYSDTSVDALYAFGGNDAKGRFELGVSSAKKRYQNNRANTAAADRDTDRARATFYARFAPKTSFLVEIQHADFDYQLSTSTLSSKEDVYFAGVTWEATAATSGVLKVGRQKKNFDASFRGDSSVSSWDIGVEWKPLTYSKVNFYSTKNFGESSGLGDAIVSKKIGAAWKHEWNSRISSTTSYSFVQDDFVGASVSRKDETDNYGFKVTYKLGRGLELGADFTRSERDSSLSGFQYKRNQFMLSVGAKL